MERTTPQQSISKVLTGIQGPDEITCGGLPQARPTLVAGYAGSGKTVLAMQFILNGIEMYDEPGVYISLEETEEDPRRNMATFGYDLEKMEISHKLSIENIKVRHSALYQSAHFGLSPIFIRIEEFITDCVISLKHEMIENIYTRRL